MNLDALDHAADRQRLFGVYPAQVVEVTDPDGQGRVRVALPWAPDPRGQACRIWARLAVPFAGGGRGAWFVPDVNDEVLIAFQAGDPRRPVVTGSLWNGRDAPPETMDSGGQNNFKTIRTRSGLVIRLDDSTGQESVRIETPGGQSLELRDGPGSVQVTDANGNTVTLETAGITVQAAAKVTISAPTVEVSAGMVTVNAGMSKFSGVVQCDTLITNAVVSAAYTPGAGNVW
jgi:uncharacterized protein involved in type VI secretion and phage assembly